MKVFLPIIMIFLFIETVFSAPAIGPGVHGTFSNLPRRLVLRQGNVFSAQSENVLTNVFQPVGDGTYYCKVNLIKGSTYNFAFQVKVKGVWVWEQLPEVGTFPTSIQSNAVTSNIAGQITKIDGNIRRTITIPNYGPNTNYYIYCNFGHHPNPPDITLTPSPGAVSVKIQSLGRWDNSPEPDVLFGGYYALYRSTDEGGPYSFITNLVPTTNNETKYIDTNVTNGQTYFYVAVSYDAYQGTSVGPYDKEVDVPDFKTALDQRYIDANMSSGYSLEKKVIPNNKVKIIFKVQNIDWDFVNEHKKIVWLTPINQDARFYKYKIIGRIAKIKLQ